MDQRVGWLIELERSDTPDVRAQNIGKLLFVVAVGVMNADKVRIIGVIRFLGRTRSGVFLFVVSIRLIAPNFDIQPFAFIAKKMQVK